MLRATAKTRQPAGGRIERSSRRSADFVDVRPVLLESDTRRTSLRLKDAAAARRGMPSPRSGERRHAAHVGGDVGKLLFDRDGQRRRPSAQAVLIGGGGLAADPVE